MFDWFKNIGAESGSMKRILSHFDGMIAHGDELFDLVSEAFFGGKDAESVRELVFATDAKINKAEQQLRRELIVHATVHGSSQFPTCLVLMSIGKDAERIGDYCKNLFDLALERPVTKDDASYAALKDVNEKASAFLKELGSLYRAQDTKRAAAYLKDVDIVEDACDDAVSKAVRGESSSPDSVVAALAMRHMKRIMAHSKNVATSLVMPVDKLDFFDEPKE